MHTSLKQFSIILKQEGTSRQERYIPALHETDKLLDDRKLQDFILYMQEYSKNLLFVNTDKEHIDYDESWEDFFGNDPVLLIAHVASINTHKIKEEYDHLKTIFQHNQTIYSFSELVKSVFAKFLQVNRWYTLSPVESILQKDLNLYIRSYLQKEMETVKEMLLYLFDHAGDDMESHKKASVQSRNEKSRKELTEMAAIWKMDQKEKIAQRDRIFNGGTEKEKFINAVVILDKTFETVYHAIGTIAERSGKYFEETMLHKQNHNPHVALILTFIRLFAHEQEEMNKIPQRLLNFYYRDVLRIKEQPAIPDQAYIVFELTKGFDTCLVKKGTKLTAGPDKQNKELIYETDKDIVLNKATVGSLRTAFLDYKKNGEVLNYYINTITPVTGKAETPSQGFIQQPGLFGEKNPAAVREIGFAIASSQFYLAKAERNIVITLNASKDIEPANALQNNSPVVDFDITIFKLLLTGEKAWISSEEEASGITIKSLKKINDITIELSFSISIAQEQAIVPFDKKIHTGNFNTSFPLMQFILKFPSEKKMPPNADQLIHQLNILRQLQINGAVISIKVGSINTQKPKISFDGVRDLILENDDGALDNKKPFYPFTAMPKVTGSFYIGCKDLFYKQIQDLSVNIEWVLPDNFRSYYQKYNPPYDSNKFLATLSYLDKKRWEKYADISLIDVNSSNAHFRTVKMDLDRIKVDTSPPPDDEIPTFDNIKKNGTLKLKLGYPDFGHSIYPQLITSTIMDKATSKSANIDYYKLVKTRLHNDIFTIETPQGVNEKNGSLKVMYDILDFREDDAQAKSMLITALSNIISKQNGIEVISKKPGQSADAIDEKESHQIVHDQNLIEKVLRIFRHLDIIKSDVHDDKEKQDVGDIIDDIDKDIFKVADFVLPSKKEMNNLIVNEVNKIIVQTISIIVDRVLEERKNNGVADPNVVASIFDDEFAKARKVINDIIAKKIAIFLSTKEIPPPPYSPLINNISVNYFSSKPMAAADGDKLFHLNPLGSVVETSIWMDEGIQAAHSGSTFLFNNIKGAMGEIAENFQLATAKYKTSSVFPQLLTAENGTASPVVMQGMLFIGIKDILPNQNLSLLFQMTEGSKDEEQKPPPVYWFYLRYNEWVQMEKSNVVSDSTNDLQTTGIVEFSIPGDANNFNAFFNTTSMYWLCAGAASNTEAFPHLADVTAQAVGVTFVDFRNNPQHMALPLEPQQIKTLIDHVTQVKKINQPVSSFNGKVGEKESEYYVRVSERLRHKNRAINNWDYENLVLERFPAFFKVKCLNHYFNGHFAVGHITVVPIADLRNKNYQGSNLLVPKTNYIDLKNIEDYLCLKASPFVKIHAINPKPEYVLVRCKVKFNPGMDKGFCLTQLDADLINFLTPWATDADKISFSGKVYASGIINFIDKRDYVAYVQDLEMFQYTDTGKENKEIIIDPDELESLVETNLTTGHSILVSAPKHFIELVE